MRIIKFSQIMGDLLSKPNEPPNSVPNENNPYEVENLDNMQREEKLKFVYLWYGHETFSEDVQKYISEFNKKGFSMEAVGDMTSLKKRVKELPFKIYLKVICSDSLAKHYYEKLCALPKVLDIFIYSSQKMSEERVQKFKELGERSLKIKNRS